MKLWWLGALAIPGIFSAALAHTGQEHLSGFRYGFFHPLGGLDHTLAMLAVGLWAAQHGGRAIWAVPLSFVGLMAVGGGLGIAGVAVPWVETGILVSVVFLGILVVLSAHFPLWASSVLVGIFAFFHGHAHGAEMPVSASGLEYALGFAIATALLHLGGIGLGLMAARFSRSPAIRRLHLLRLSGAVVLLGGVYLSLVG